MASTRALLRLLRPISRYRALSCTTESLLFKKRLSSSTPPTTLSRPQLKRSSVNSSRKRFYSDTLNQDPEPPDYLSETELHIFHKLLKELGPSKLEVQDISGGCGSMFAIEVVSKRFRGLSVIKQHRLVNEVLGEEIKGWHGLQLKTKVG